MVHAPYVVNLASLNNRIRIPSRKIVVQHAEAAAQVGAVGLVVHGEVQKSYAVYVLNQLGHSNPPIASFGSLSIYRLSGECAGSAPCLETAHE